MSTLSTFKTKVTSDKLAQQHYYKVSLFKVPNGVGSKNNDSNQFQQNDVFDIWCQAAKMPGQTLTELELKKHNFLFRMPDHVEFDGTWSVDILIDLSWKNYQRLLAWQNTYYNISADGGGERGFPETYAEVKPLNNKFKVMSDVPGMQIYGIYPKTVPTIDLSQEDSQYIKPTVEFGYSYTNYMSDIVDPIGGGSK